MSKRAEDAAQKAYPATEYSGQNVYQRFYYRRGYEQAEKDLGWISVMERLPEPKQNVITCVDFNGVPQALDVCDYRNGKWYSWLSDRFVGYVDYWMPVQPLPKKEEQ